MSNHSTSVLPKKSSLQSVGEIIAARKQLKSATAAAWWIPLHYLVTDENSIHRRKLGAALWVYLYCLCYANRRNGSAFVPAKDFSRHFPTIEVLTKAALEQFYVRLNYQNLQETTPLPRKFAPYSIYLDPDGTTLKVIGFDEKRRDIIPLSIDHTKKIEQLGENFVRPADFNLRQFLAANCFNGIHGKPVRVRLKTFGVTARIFRERTFHPTQRIIKTRKQTNTAGESLTIEMCVAAGRGLERFVLSWMPEIEVVSPLMLRE